MDAMAEADPDSEATSPVAWGAARAIDADAVSPGASVEQALQAVVDLHGPAMFYEADALRAELEARCPGATDEIALLLIGLEEQIPQALLAVHADDDATPLALRLERRLRMRRSLEPVEASWVVRTWARVLRLWSAAATTEALRPIGRRDEASAAGVATSTAVDADDDAPRVVAPVNRWYGIGGLVAAAAVVVAIVRYQPIAPPQAGTPPMAQAGAASTASATMAAATPALPPEPRIVDVTTSEPLVADGRQREVFVAMRNPHGAIDSVESRFVDGDAALRTPPTVVDVSSDPIRDGRVPAGLIGARSTKPMQATFEYVVTMSDGTRSAPFTKRLELAPIPATPPAIEDVVLPDGIVAGRPFKATIAFRAGDAPVASVESSIVSGDATGTPRVTPVAAPTTSGDGDGTIRVQAVADRSPTTMEFALIDADGMRSDAKRVSFDVATRAVARCREPGCAPVAGPPSLAASRDAGLRVGPTDDGPFEGGGAGAGRGTPRDDGRPARSTTAGSGADDRAIAKTGTASEDRGLVTKPDTAAADDRASVGGARSATSGTGGRAARPAADRKATREAKVLPESVPLFGPDS